eukprot:TRINITY_DN2997_c0_g1_i7.p2 TRINITY_DN2997_c0_g1~~TRINITY_DN2997_c0_g1_i7.p2  ORF type:complete len:213 (+),score=54.54 TRINITY_DN2997_c0_g1_i7:1016-1654(+)
MRMLYETIFDVKKNLEVVTTGLNQQKETTEKLKEFVDAMSANDGEFKTSATDAIQTAHQNLRQTIESVESKFQIKIQAHEKELLEALNKLKDQIVNAAEENTKKSEKDFEEIRKDFSEKLDAQLEIQKKRFEEYERRIRAVSSDQVNLQIITDTDDHIKKQGLMLKDLDSLVKDVCVGEVGERLKFFSNDPADELIFADELRSVQRLSLIHI